MRYFMGYDNCRGTYRWTQFPELTGLRGACKVRSVGRLTWCLHGLVYWPVDVVPARFDLLAGWRGACKVWSIGRLTWFPQGLVYWPVYVVPAWLGLQTWHETATVCGWNAWVWRALRSLLCAAHRTCGSVVGHCNVLPTACVAVGLPSFRHSQYVYRRHCHADRGGCLGYWWDPCCILVVRRIISMKYQV